MPDPNQPNPTLRLPNESDEDYMRRMKAQQISQGFQNQSLSGGGAFQNIRRVLGMPESNNGGGAGGPS